MVMRRLILSSILLGISLAACDQVFGIQDHSLAATTREPANDGSTGVEVDAAEPLADGGGDDQASPPSPVGEAGPDAPPGCSTGSLRCMGNTPQTCTGGVWESGSPCGASSPVCSNGVCGTFRTTGGLRSVAPVAAGADAGIRLVSGGFELGTRSCDEAGVCVTGGLVP